MLGTFPEKGLLGFKNKLVGNDNRGVFPIGCDLIYALVKPSGDIGTLIISIPKNSVILK